jgi:uncharacterized membrane protein YeaQ/YmgE (transglycosylase-associated protein family)
MVLKKSALSACVLQPVCQAPLVTYPEEEAIMGFDGVGWLAAIIIGGVAGWLAGVVMKSSTGVLMNIVLGVVGAIIASIILGVLGVQFNGWVGYLIAGFIGACILIAIGRAVSSRRS